MEIRVPGPVSSVGGGRGLAARAARAAALLARDAREPLHTEADTPQTHERHGRHYLALAERGEPKLHPWRGPLAAAARRRGPLSGRRSTWTSGTAIRDWRCASPACWRVLGHRQPARRGPGVDRDVPCTAGDGGSRSPIVPGPDDKGSSCRAREPPTTRRARCKKKQEIELPTRWPDPGTWAIRQASPRRSFSLPGRDGRAPAPAPARALAEEALSWASQAGDDRLVALALTERALAIH